MSSSNREILVRMRVAPKEMPEGWRRWPVLTGTRHPTMYIVREEDRCGARVPMNTPEACLPTKDWMILFELKIRDYLEARE